MRWHLRVVLIATSPALVRSHLRPFEESAADSDPGPSISASSSSVVIWRHSHGCWQVRRRAAPASGGCVRRCRPGGRRRLGAWHRFQEDLFRLETHGAPLWDGVAEIYVRPALPEEEAKCRRPGPALYRVAM